MEGRKAELLQRVESDHEVLLDFLRSFIRCPSPDPPGDTRKAAGHIRRLLERHGTQYRVIAPNELMPNIVATFEAAFGPYCARYLSEHHPEVFGDTCLNGEPSSPPTLRFGEKGPLWLEFTVRTKGAHGAYTHARKSATAIAAKLIGALEELRDIPAPEASNLAAALDEAAPAIDRAQGPGASRITRRVTVNPGVVHGGLKVNMVASDCTFAVDIRLPNGLDAPQILAGVDKIVASYPEVTYRVINYNSPSWCPPDAEIALLVRANAKGIAGIDPMPIVSLGGTDARLWRYKDIPAIVYGPSPTGMGSVDEHVTVEEFFHVVK